jgi:hypothetical protein
MALPRPARPSVAYADLRDFLRQRPRHRWVAATLAVIIPMALLAAFFVDASMSARPRPDIHYINSWPADRSDEEIKASQQAAVERRQAIQDESPAPVPAPPKAGGGARHHPC